MRDIVAMLVWGACIYAPLAAYMAETNDGTEAWVQSVTREANRRTRDVSHVSNGALQFNVARGGK